jgi:sporulation and cell division protein SsgA
MGSFFYTPVDPYAIRIALHVGLDEPVQWIFARDLLSMDTGDREGIGDVHVWPSPASAGGEPGSILNIELFSPFGKAHLEAPAREVSDFVRQTYRIVPDGQESDHIDVEAELNDLLRLGS